MVKRTILAMAVFMMLTGTVAAGPVILKWGTWEPPVGWANKNMWIPWIEKINKIDPDTIQIKFFPGGTLGKNPMSYVKLLSDGVMDIGWIPNPYHPGIFPDDLVFNLPFLSEGSYQASVAAWRLYEKGALRGYKDYHPLSIVTSGQYILTTTFPVRKPSDLKGKKLRAGGQIQFKFIEAFGATPIPIPITKSAEALSRGIIQGGIVEPALAKTFRLSSITKYHLILPFGCVTVMASMSKKGFDGLPDNAKAFLNKHTGEQLSKIFGKRNDASNLEVIAEWQKDPDHTVFIPNPEQTKEWKDLMKPVVERWKKEDPKNEAVYDACVKELANVK